MFPSEQFYAMYVVHSVSICISMFNCYSIGHISKLSNVDRKWNHEELSKKKLAGGVSSY